MKKLLEFNNQPTDNAFCGDLNCNGKLTLVTTQEHRESIGKHWIGVYGCDTCNSCSRYVNDGGYLFFSSIFTNLAPLVDASQRDQI